MRKKELRKSLLSSGTHFSFQTESRGKYPKRQVVSNQVYVREIYEEHQVILGYSKSHQHIAHSPA